MKKLKTGIVGTGFIADFHHQGFVANPDAEVTGICRTFYGDEQNQQRQKKNLEDKANELGIKAYPDFDTMVTDPEIDALVIGSINPEHFDQIKTAVDNKKAVLVEKPVVTDLEKVEELKKMEQNSGAKIFPAHNFVYRSAVQKAKEIIASGALGQIIHGSFVVTHTIGEGHATGWRSKLALGNGGTLMDSGHHLVYQTLYLLGNPIRISGFASKLVLKNMEGEDTAQVGLAYPDGSMAVVMQSWTSDHAEGINGIRIFGTKGNIIISDALYHNGEKISDDVEYHDSFKNQARAFSDFVLHGKEPLSNLDDVANTLKIIYGCYDSDKQEKIIVL